ncbi:hypothetical protein BDP27DRAFT_1425958 [Rhodocollybia butyracea]|uniref:Uncharacterized protein n=1 Tax=Rhodocollybia butyracea TaxID=206335 RepID=A0A9P5PEV4_9AGAR|nr:hypothetical protein BDP27DRAFT_1425958 [Rhodocollybia butyracea]
MSHGPSMVPTILEHVSLSLQFNGAIQIAETLPYPYKVLLTCFPYSSDSSTPVVPGRISRSSQSIHHTSSDTGNLPRIGVVASSTVSVLRQEIKALKLNITLLELFDRQKDLEIHHLQSDACGLANTVNAFVSADLSAVLPLLNNALTKIHHTHSRSGTHPSSEASSGLLLIDLVQHLRPSILQQGPLDMGLVHHYVVPDHIPSVSELVHQYRPDLAALAAALQPSSTFITDPNSISVSRSLHPVLTPSNSVIPSSPGLSLAAAPMASTSQPVVARAAYTGTPVPPGSSLHGRLLDPHSRHRSHASRHCRATKKSVA